MESNIMSASAPPAAGYRRLSKRRIVLLATVAGLGAGIVFGDYGLTPKSGGALLAPAYAQAQTARPAGFADIVEKVKPAVISVKVKMNGGNVVSLNEDNPLRGTPFEDFFRRFGQPDGSPRFGRPDGDQPGTPRQQRR